jgi:hypothetical protein
MGCEGRHSGLSEELVSRTKGWRVEGLFGREVIWVPVDGRGRGASLSSTSKHQLTIISSNLFLHLPPSHLTVDIRIPATTKKRVGKAYAISDIIQGRYFYPLG